MLSKSSISLDKKQISGFDVEIFDILFAEKLSHQKMLGDTIRSQGEKIEFWKKKYFLEKEL